MAMNRRVKLYVGLAAALLGLLTICSPFVVNYVQVTMHRQWNPEHQLADVIKHIRSRGITSELNDLLAKGPQPEGWLLNYVTPPHPLSLGVVPPSSRPDVILAASRPEVVGRDMGEGLREVSRPGMTSTGADVSGPDGTHYTLWMAGVMNRQPERLAIGSAIAVLVLAWLALTVWLYLDVRDTGKATAWGWLLLGLMAGPVALAVWLIYRYAQWGSDKHPRVCPGCGADTVRDAAFCVRCGHGLMPSCPDCRRPVEVDWAYCGTCGSDLSAS